MTGILFLHRFLLVFHMCSMMMAAEAQAIESNSAEQDGSSKAICKMVEMNNRYEYEYTIDMRGIKYAPCIELSKKIELADATIVAKNHVGFCVENAASETIELMTALERAYELELWLALEGVKAFCNRVHGKEVIDKVKLIADRDHRHFSFEFMPGCEGKNSLPTFCKKRDEEKLRSLLEDMKRKEVNLTVIKNFKLHKICHAKIGKSDNLYTLYLIYCFTDEKNRHDVRKIDLQLTEPIYKNLWSYVGLSSQ